MAWDVESTASLDATSAVWATQPEKSGAEIIVARSMERNMCDLLGAYGVGTHLRNPRAARRATRFRDDRGRFPTKGREMAGHWPATGIQGYGVIDSTVT
jgi:hypothetical protein